MQKLIAVGLPICTVGAAVNVLARNMRESHVSIFQSDAIYETTLIASAGFAIGGLILIIIGFLSYFKRLPSRVKNVPEWVKIQIKRNWPEMILERAKTNELSWISDFAIKYFGSGVSPLNLMQSLYAKNGEVFWLIKECDQKSGSYREINVGYFSLLPLNKRASASVQRGELDGSRIDKDDIATRYARPNSFYIGAIAADTLRARSFALLNIQYHMSREKFKEVHKIYAKAATKDGLRLLKRHGFSPIDTQSQGEVGDLFYRDRVSQTV